MQAFKIKNPPKTFEALRRVCWLPSAKIPGLKHGGLNTAIILLKCLRSARSSSWRGRHHHGVNLWNSPRSNLYPQRSKYFELLASLSACVRARILIIVETDTRNVVKVSFLRRVAILSVNCLLCTLALPRLFFSRAYTSTRTSSKSKPCVLACASPNVFTACSVCGGTGRLMDDRLH